MGSSDYCAFGLESEPFGLTTSAMITVTPLHDLFTPRLPEIPASSADGPELQARGRRGCPGRDVVH